jgi:hypothetical protein
VVFVSEIKFQITMATVRNFANFRSAVGAFDNIANNNLMR